jgi:hypothetical protein
MHRLLARSFPLALLALLALLAPSVAGALSLSMAGPTSGPITTGLGVENPSVGDPITFTVALDATAEIQGYDLIMSWDPAELAFLSATDLSGIGFDVAPLGSTPEGERVAAIDLAPVSTAALFRVDFEVLAVLRDGVADLRVVANGSGIAPGSLSLSNGAAGVAFALPEPHAAALLTLALGALGMRRWRRRTRPASDGSPR